MENKEFLDSNSEIIQNSENVVNDETQNISEQKSTDVNSNNSNVIEEKQQNAAELILKKLADRKKKDETSENFNVEEIVLKSDVTNSADEVEKLSSFNENVTEEISLDVSTEIIDDIDEDASIKEVIAEEEEEIERTTDLPDISQLTKEELITVFKEQLEKPVAKIRLFVDLIKTTFYKKHKAESAEKRRIFLEENKKEDGTEVEYKPEPDALELEFKELYKQYRDLRAIRAQEIEKNKQKNLQAKYKIIEEIDNLINNKETLSNTFEEFKNLQKQWKEIGIVPQNDVKQLWDKYNYSVEKFYDFVKINKELRDLDFRKNLEAKIELCERAEELILEPKIVKAFKELQKLHDQWRDIGPISNEKKEEIWERFKNATNQINKIHQEYFDNLKQEQENNLKAKTLISERAEELANDEANNHKKWEENSKEIIELQQIWRLIGFAPKKFNNQIYKRFREACDLFFERKRDFYNQSREEQDNNLQLKTDLCVQVESLIDSTDWRKTSDLIINLQKKWKEVGPVPKKNSDEIWKRFRAACNKFFETKEKFFSERHVEEDNNLKLKLEIIEKLKNFDKADDDKENLRKLKELQLEWSQVGYVPIKHKDEIQKQYRQIIEQNFSHLKIDEYKRDELRLKNLIDDSKNQPRAKDKLITEKERLKNKLDKIQSEIVLWENNLGFFAKSKNAETMIADFNKKIETAKTQAKSLQKQINLLETEQNSID